MILVKSLAETSDMKQQKVWYGGAMMICGSLLSLLRSRSLIEHGIRSDVLSRNMMQISDVLIDESIPAYCVSMKVLDLCNYPQKKGKKNTSI